MHVIRRVRGPETREIKKERVREWRAFLALVQNGPFVRWRLPLRACDQVVAQTSIFDKGEIKNAQLSRCHARRFQ